MVWTSPIIKQLDLWRTVVGPDCDISLGSLKRKIVFNYTPRYSTCDGSACVTMLSFVVTCESWPCFHWHLQSPQVMLLPHMWQRLHLLRLRHLLPMILLLRLFWSCSSWWPFSWKLPASPKLRCLLGRMDSVWHEMLFMRYSNKRAMFWKEQALNWLCDNHIRASPYFRSRTTKSQI